MNRDYLLSDPALLLHCRIETFRAQGPGGQHTNRTESAVRITHRASGVTAQCQDHREQAHNHKDALKRLRLRLALSQRGPVDATLLVPYRRGSRFTIGSNHAHYAVVVAVVLDALMECAGALRAVAELLEISTSQLSKLLTADKEVHAAANAIRAQHGLGVMHG